MKTAEAVVLKNGRSIPISRKVSTGGLQGDAGLIGRIFIINSYGDRDAHGGGAFSGNDPTMVDRSGKSVVKNWLITYCLVKAFLRRDGWNREASQRTTSATLDCRLGAVVVSLALSEPRGTMLGEVTLSKTVCMFARRCFLFCQSLDGCCIAAHDRQ